MPIPDWILVVRQTLTWAVRAIAVWLAVTTPFLYLPLLVRGFSGRGEVLAFVGLLVVNAASLVLGHRHRT